MKIVSILCFLIILIFPVFGQKVSILDASLKWNIGAHCVNEGPNKPYDYWKTTFQKIGGDTVVNEMSYKTIVSCSDSLCNKKEFKFLIRENSGKIYLANSTKEFIFCDFNLQKGDTMLMSLFNIDYQYFIRIDSIKNLSLNDKKIRIFQYVSVFDYYKGKRRELSRNDVFVEGVGSLKFGLEYPGWLFMTGSSGCFHSLLCFYSAGHLTYSNPTLNKCYLNTGSIQLLDQQKLVNVHAVHHGNLEIQLNGIHSGRITFFDLKGNQILAENIKQSNTHVCLPSTGIYIFNFISKKGKVQTGKILVN